MDPILIGGLLLSFLAIVVATLIDGNSSGVLRGPPSFVLVLFGTLGRRAHRRTPGPSC